MSQLLRLVTHLQEASERTTERSRWRGCRKSMSSTHASWRNPAFFMREASSRFWRTDTSRSTSSPSRSSKERTWYSDNWPCSLRASLIPVSLRARSLSRVGCSSMSVLLHVISGGVLAVVVGTAQVFVQQRRLLLLGCGNGQHIEAVLENGGHTLVGAQIAVEGALGGGFEAQGTVFVPQAQDPQAGAVGLLGHRAAGEDVGDELLGMRSVLCGAGQELLFAPLGLPVRRRHVI